MFSGGLSDTIRLILVLVVACAGVAHSRAAEDPVADPALKIHPVPGQPYLLFGSAPSSPDDFQALSMLGVQIVISVDGASPMMEAAGETSIKFAHVPVGYDTITRAEIASILKVIQANPDQKVFLHCHHGKHRAPAAIASSLVSCGKWTHEQGIALLKKAGTSPDYPGLYSAVRHARPISSDRIDKAPFPPPSVPPNSIIDVMTRMDHHFDYLKKLSKKASPPTKGNDSIQMHIPRNHAKLLHEQFLEWNRSIRNSSKHDFQPDFLNLLDQGENLSESLFRAIPASNPATNTEFHKALQSLQNNCRSCHRTFRN